MVATKISASVACALVLVSVLVFGADPVRAQVPPGGPTFSVTPATGLVHGQTVRFDITGGLPSTTYSSAVCGVKVPVVLSDCDLTAVAHTTTDASGSASVTRTVKRFILTNAGYLDCADIECVLGVTVLSDVSQSLGTVPLSFADVPHPSNGVGVRVTGPAYLDRDPTGRVTVPIELTCTTYGWIAVEVWLKQLEDDAGPARQDSDKITVQWCAPGVPIAGTTDLLGRNVRSGRATVLLRATMSGGREGWDQATLEVRSHADQLAELHAQLADPDQPDVVQNFIDLLAFRVKNNPDFARDFWRAVFQGVGG